MPPAKSMLFVLIPLALICLLPLLFLLHSLSQSGPSGNQRVASLLRPPNGDMPVLYTPGVDPVLQLDEETFHNTVLNSSTPTLVEVYDYWCGHCRAFAPTFSAFAHSLASWPPGLVQVATINCGDLHNVGACKECMRVGEPLVPAFKFIPAGAASIEAESEFEPHSMTLEGIRSALVEVLAKGNKNGSYASELMKTRVLQLPDNWEGNASEVSLDQFIHSVWAAEKKQSLQPSSITHIVLVVEEEEGTPFDKENTNTTSDDDADKRSRRNSKSGKMMGTQIHLDLWPYRERMAVFELSGEAASSLAALLNITSYPHLVLVSRSRSDSSSAGGGEKEDPQLLYSGEASHNVTKRLVRLAGLQPEGSQLDQAPREELWKSKGLIDCQHEPERCSQLFYASEADMLKAMRIAIYEEVLLAQAYRQLRASDFTNLRTFIQLLIEHFPTTTRMPIKNGMEDVPMHRSENARAFFTSLAAFMDEGETFTGDEWNTTFLAREAEHNFPFPVHSPWEHCHGTSPQFRGFTCGLWTALHAMTVSAYEKHLKQAGSSNHSGGGGDLDFAVRPIRAIRGWVDSYFSCGECRYHFLQMTDEQHPLEGPKSDVRRPEDAFLYLWRGHNRANTGLRGDVTEDPQFPKYQFPAEFLCPRCRVGEKEKKKEGNSEIEGEGGNSGKTKKGNEWEMKELEEFLINYYTRIRPHQ